MIRTTSLILFVLGTLTVISAAGVKKWSFFNLTLTSMKGKTPLMLMEDDFEHGVTNRELQVIFPGVSDANLITIKIYQNEDSEPIIEYPVETPMNDPTKPKVFYFVPKDASSGEFSVQYCTRTTCSEKTTAFRKVIDEEEKQTKITCLQGTGKEDATLQRFIGEDATFSTFEIEMIGPDRFIEDRWYRSLGASDNEAFKKLDYSKLALQSNPAYTQFGGKKVFYAAVFFEAKHFKQMFDTAVSEDEKARYYKEHVIQRKLFNEVHTHAYCERKYIFSANAHIVDPETKQVMRRFRTSVHISDYIKTKYIFNEMAPNIHVEITHYDEEKKALPPKIYDVAVSLCATDKDRVDSTICSKSLVQQLQIDRIDGIDEIEEIEETEIV